MTTRNPSNDDNIFFASFFLTVKASVIVNPPANQPPVANAGGPYTGAEGSSIVHGQIRKHLAIDLDFSFQQSVDQTAV